MRRLEVSMVLVDEDGFRGKVDLEDEKMYDLRSSVSADKWHNGRRIQHGACPHIGISVISYVGQSCSQVIADFCESI